MLPGMPRVDLLVGRTAEIAALTADLDGVRGGAGATVLLAGEPGIGKTTLAAALAARAREADVHENGTVVVVQGPRFSTRAESAMYRRLGFHVVNMTQYPEAWLARELELCYAAVMLVTDYDVGLADDPSVEPVSAEAAFRVFAENLSKLRDLLFRAVPKIGPQPDDICARALSDAIVL